MNYKVYTENGFEYVELTDEQKSFLRGYTPKDSYFTSVEEMGKIKEVFGFGSDVPARAIRNSVVAFYSTYMKEIGRSDERYWDVMQGMMSVTAVIDHYKYTF